MDREWRATHRLTLVTGYTLDVMYEQHADGGPAYTRSEWQTCDLPDVEMDGDGRWWILGEPFGGTVETLGSGKRSAAKEWRA